MNASELLEAIKANPADFVGRLGSSIRKFLTEEIGSTDKWWGSYREPSKYGSSIWKESGRFDPDDLDTWTKREQENAKKFLNLNKLLTAATKIEDFLFFIDLNGNLVDPPRQISTYEKLSLSPHSGGCMGFLAEFAAAFDFLCQLFIPKKSSANFEGFREKYDTCIAGSQWLEAIGSIPGSLRVSLPRVDLVPDTNSRMKVIVMKSRDIRDRYHLTGKQIRDWAKDERKPFITPVAGQRKYEINPDHPELVALMK